MYQASTTPPPPNYDPTQASMAGAVDQETRTWAIVTHISPIAGFVVPFGHIIAPLVIWLIKKQENLYLAAHAKEMLNFQLSMTIWLSIATLASLFLIGIPFLIGLALLDLGLIVYGTIQASKDELFSYPLKIEFVK